MSDDTKLKELTELFEETGKAHHQAFLDTDGEDPEWPLWYAEYLEKRLQPFLATPMTKSRLVYCLVGADNEHRATSSGTPWPEFYATHVLECFGAATAPLEEKLALYHFDGCPFCMRVRRAIDLLGIDVELRNIYENREHLDALMAARGRATVPVLRITGPNEDRWMPESADIVRYLQATYDDAAA